MRLVVGPYQPPGPNYGWFVCLDPGTLLVAHRLAVGAPLAPRPPALSPAVCGDARPNWTALDSVPDPEVYIRCPTCQSYP